MRGICTEAGARPPPDGRRALRVGYLRCAGPAAGEAAGEGLRLVLCVLFADLLSLFSVESESGLVMDAAFPLRGAKLSDVGYTFAPGGGRFHFDVTDTLTHMHTTPTRLHAEEAVAKDWLAAVRKAAALLRGGGGDGTNDCGGSQQLSPFALLNMEVAPPVLKSGMVYKVERRRMSLGRRSEKRLLQLTPNQLDYFDEQHYRSATSTCEAVAGLAQDVPGRRRDALKRDEAKGRFVLTQIASVERTNEHTFALRMNEHYCSFASRGKERCVKSSLAPNPA